jgi:aspartyl protease family protein
VVSVGIRDIQVILEGRNVRVLRLGEVSPEGVKLTAIDNGAALLEVNGRAITLRPGQSIASRTVLLADSQGHFVTNALINGVPVRALVDTGATYVSLSVADAQRMGIDYQRGKRTVSQTANGPILAYIVNLTHVQVGDIAFANVSGLVLEDGLGQQIPALIGMSFLRNVEMRQTGNTMVLQQADR